LSPRSSVASPLPPPIETMRSGVEIPCGMLL
jgi:hypothetical protein